VIAAAFADPALQVALRLSLAAMFTAAALHKLQAPATFAATLRNYRILPDATTTAAAAALIGAELATATVLLAVPASSGGAVAALVLMALYSSAIALALGRGLRDIDCGCLGPGHRQPLSEWLLARNAAVAAGAALLLTPAGARALGWLDGFSAIAFTAALTLVWSAGNRLLQTAPRHGEA
jgi:hypothetical protein